MRRGIITALAATVAALGLTGAITVTTVAPTLASPTSGGVASTTVGGTDSVTVGSCTGTYDYTLVYNSDNDWGGIIWDSNPCDIETQAKVEFSIGCVPGDDYDNSSGIVEGVNIWDKAFSDNPFLDVSAELKVHFRTDDTTTWGSWQTKATTPCDFD
jgi:hypothetical protein